MIEHLEYSQSDKQFLVQFKSLLRKHNYTYDYLMELGINPFTFSQFDLPILAKRFPLHQSFATLFHLFFLGRKLKLEVVEKIFKPKEIAELLRIKVLEKTDNENIQSSVFLIPYKHNYFACDFVLQLSDRVIINKQKKIEYVYPVGLDSITLCESAIKNPVDSALDLGCGSGIISLIASTNSKSVTGVDLNPRAVNFSRFNAILNNVNNCQFLCGDLYTPVKDKKFDLILSNPPYEITSKNKYLYKDGGIHGDKILQRIIKDLPVYLNQNGFCQIITRIGQFQNEKREINFQKWAGKSKLKIFYIENYKQSIYEYAYSVCTDYLGYENLNFNYREYSNKINKILDFFTEIKLIGVSFGLITITHDKHFSYKEIAVGDYQSPVELSYRLSDLVYKHFESSLIYKNSKLKWRIVQLQRMLFHYIFK